MRERLLWIGDAGCDTGFAKCTHYTLEGLRQEFEVFVLGLNYRGDHHEFPYRMYPAWPGGDLFGIGRVNEMLKKIRPQVVVIQNDPWNIPLYVEQIEATKDVPRPTLIGAIAIDGLNCRGRALNGLDHCIFWTKFAQYEALKGGYQNSSTIIPLGVELDVFCPGDKLAARKAMGFPENTWNGFIVGNVNRNQPRKRLDLSIQYFANWIRQRNIDDAFLYLHVAPTGDAGYDCQNLARYYKLEGKILICEPPVYSYTPDSWVAQTYNSFDVQINTGVGEGWGLPTMEGMACGVPQIVGGWSALSEWAADAAYLIKCRRTCLPNKINVIGGEPDEEHFIAALDHVYQFPNVREEMRRNGLALVSRPEYRWENIAAEFTKVVREVAGE